MTADQLADRLIELRRKYRADIDEAKRREQRVKALFEELYGLGVAQVKCEQWCSWDNKTPQDARDRLVHDMQAALRQRFYSDAHALIKEFVGIP